MKFRLHHSYGPGPRNRDVKRKRRATSLTPAIFVAFSVMTLATGLVTDVKAVDPATGVIRTLFIGDPFMKPGFPTPALAEDPKITVTPVLAELYFVAKKDMIRYMRMYLPRTKKQLVVRHDLVVLAAIRADHLSHAFEKWVAEAVLEGEIAVLMADDPVSFGCVDAWEGTGSPSWMETPIGEILPVDDRTRKNYENIRFKFKPDSDHPFTKGIPWDKVSVQAHNRPTERPGATVLLRTSEETAFGGYKDALMTNSPVVIYMDVEKGRSTALVYDWGGNGVTDFYRWEYWRDVVARWFYLPVDAEIPTDVQLTHNLRQMMTDYGVQRGITISMLEFADLMGANVGKIERELGSVNALRKRTDELWIQGEFQQCRNELEEVLEMLTTVNAQALAAKESALLWIYITEWTAVTGTLCAAGSLVWTLMIRKSMYREVRTTRFSEGNS